MIDASDVLRPLDVLERRAKRFFLGVALVALLALLYHVLVTRPEQAREQGTQYGAAQCAVASASQAVTATVAAANDGATKAQGDINKAQAIGAVHEQARLRLDQFYDRLSLEASYDAPHPVDACVLPADRLRRWAQANAGPAGAADQADHSSPLAQPAAAASGPASTPIGRDAGSGDEPQRSGEGLPSGGSATVRPPETSGD